MTSFGAKRLSKITPSPTVSLPDKARALRAEGFEVFDLAEGEPYFDTPERIKEAAKAALDEGFVRYTQSSGIPELKEAITEKLERENGVTADPSEIIVTVGSKQAIFSVFLSLLNPGDRVIMTDPRWVSYEAMARIAGAVPVLVRLKEKEDFRLDPDELETKIGKRTRMIMINSPNNPTGTVFTKDDLEGIAEIAKRHDLYVVTDEIYEKIIYDGWKHYSIASFPGMEERAITVNGFSKTYAMTGWRLGYLAADRRIIEKMNIVQQHSVTNATSFVQKAAVVALRECEEDVKRMVGAYEKNRNFIVKALNDIDGLSCWMPKGAFYAFPRINKPDVSSQEVTEYLLDKAKVLIVPGIAFGQRGEGYLRIVYSRKLEELTEAVESIKAAFEEIGS